MSKDTIGAVILIVMFFCWWAVVIYATSKVSKLTREVRAFNDEYDSQGHM